MKKKLKSSLLVLTTVILSAAFFACTPTSLEKAEKKMKLEGYTVIKTVEEAEGFVGGFSAEKPDDGRIEKLIALLFDSRSSAKKYYESAVEGSNLILDGKWVYSGTEDGIDDFTD